MTRYENQAGTYLRKQSIGDRRVEVLNLYPITPFQITPPASGYN